MILASVIPMIILSQSFSHYDCTGTELQKTNLISQLAKKVI